PYKTKHGMENLSLFTASQSSSFYRSVNHLQQHLGHILRGFSRLNELVAIFIHASHQDALLKVCQRNYIFFLHASSTLSFPFGGLRLCPLLGCRCTSALAFFLLGVLRRILSLICTDVLQRLLYGRLCIWI